MSLTAKTSVRWDTDKVERAVKEAEEEAPMAGAEFLLDKANESVPRESGELADSGYVEFVDDEAVVGYSSEYAVRQHEGDYQHDDGRRKWLELTAREEARGIGDEMADRTKEAFD